MLLTKPTEASPPLVMLDNVTFRYPSSASGSQPALDAVSVVVQRGDRFGIIGPNGGGKTTLVRLLLGIITLQSGTARVFGVRPRWTTHCPDIGYIGNPSRNEGESGLPADLTVKSLLASHRSLFVGSGRRYPHADTLAAAFQLDQDEWQNKRISDLTDGWRQRVLCFLALAKEPALLVADEATSGLDTDHRGPFLKLVRHLLDTTEMAVLWITHDYSELDDLNLRPLRLERGQLSAVSHGDVAANGD
jgi:zinc transport system ATP-binding protein